MTPTQCMSSLPKIFDYMKNWSFIMFLLKLFEPNFCADPYSTNDLVYILLNLIDETGILIISYFYEMGSKLQRNGSVFLSHSIALARAFSIRD